MPFGISFSFLNSKLLTITRKSVNYGQNTGNLYAITYGRILLIYGYVAGSDSGKNYLLATINDVRVIEDTQIIIQVGGNPTEPYCTFGTLTVGGQLTVGASAKGTTYRINCAAVIK